MTGQVVLRLPTASRRAALRWLGAAATTCGFGRLASTQEIEPIKVVIAFPPGGTSTASMQPLEAPLRQALGAPIELDYRPGAGGNVAALYVVQSKADGRTLLLGHAGPLAINHHISVQTVFDAQKDLTPIALVVEYPIVVCAAAKLNVSSMADLIALARRNQLVVGSSGNGSIQHLAAEMFSQATKTQMIHIPFAGGGPLQQAFERGAIDVLMETGSNIVKHVQAGTLRPLGVMAHERLSILPGVSTLSEQGMPGLEVAAWFGLLAPARTPDHIIRRLSSVVLDAVAQPGVRAGFVSIGGIARPLPPDVFRKFIAEENERWGKLIREIGVTPLGTGINRSIGAPQ